MTQRIVLFGGSFDPVHLAHLALARCALQSQQADQVQLIPAGQPWQRPALGASPQQRLHMLELAIADIAGLSINTIEIERTGPTYTLDTVRNLPSGPRYLWLLGSDQLARFHTWHHWQEIVHHVDLLVAQRPGTPMACAPALRQALTDNDRDLLELPFEPLDISSSAIRHRIAAGQPTEGLLPPAVRHYIDTHHLYLS